MLNPNPEFIPIAWHRSAASMRTLGKPGALVSAAVLVASMMLCIACKSDELAELERQKSEMRKSHDRNSDSDAILMVAALENMTRIAVSEVELVRDGGSLEVTFYDQSNNRWIIAQHHQSTTIRACETYCDGTNDIFLQHKSKAEENLLRLLGPVADTNALVKKIIAKCCRLPGHPP